MGHQGVVRTYLRVKEKFSGIVWARQQKNSKFKNANRKIRCPMSKMKRVHLDFLGPLPESTSGNTNILVMVDQFTKWVECKPLISQTAEVTARAAVNEFFLNVLVSRYVKCSKFTKVAQTIPTFCQRSGWEIQQNHHGCGAVFRW